MSRELDRQRITFGLPLVGQLLIVLCLTFGLITGAAAQTGELQVMLTQVDSQAFPQVTAYVTVSDENGLPVTGLTAADFAAVEDSLPLPAANLTIESAVVPGLQLVLGLDLSTPPESLAAVKTAAKSFVATLQPQDRLALVAYYDEFRLIYDFTNNSAALQAAIDSLTGQGNWTTLYQTIDETAALLDALPPGRKAVILLNDKRNNIGNFPVEQALNRLKVARTPLYVLGLAYTDKIVRTDLKPIDLPASGKIVAMLNSPDEALPQLEAIADQLRQGYRLTFPSQLQGDNAEHTLVVKAAAQGSSGQAQGRFMAFSSGQVVVTLPGLTAGQTVGGVVNLTAQVKAPAPVASVEYLLDGQSLQQEAGPPYFYEWDSTGVPTGVHTLVAKAIDTAGNQGQAELQLNVVPPLVVTVLTARNQIRPGDTVPVQAIIEAVNEVTSVELWLDGRLLIADNTPPYRFSIPSAAYTPGEHVMMVQAKDKLGRVAQGNLTLQFLAAPWRLIDWLRPVLIAAAILLALLLLWLLAWLLWRRRRQPYKFALVIANLGNISSRYKLRAEEPAGQLDFSFMLGHTLLAAEPVPVYLEPQGVQTGPAASYPTQPDGPIAAGRQGQRSMPQFKKPEGANQLQKAGSKLSGIAALTSPLVTLTVMIASFLPRSIGEPMQRWANGIMQQQTRVQSQVSYTQSNISSTRHTFQSAGGQLASAVPAKPTLSQAAPAPDRVAVPTAPPPPALAETQPMIRTPAVSTRATNGGASRSAPVQSGWVWTPAVEPGETLNIELLISPFKPNLAQTYKFTVTSRPVDAADAPAVIERGELEVIPPSKVWRILALVLFILATVVITVLTSLVVMWLLNLT